MILSECSTTMMRKGSFRCRNTDIWQNTSTCPSCFMEVLRGVVACPFCKVFFILKDMKTGLDFSPVKRVYRRKLEPNLPPSQAQMLELTEEDLARPEGDLRMVIGSKISRVLTCGGITHMSGFNSFVRKTAKVTITWQIKMVDGINRWKAAPWTSFNERIHPLV